MRRRSWGGWIATWPVGLCVACSPFAGGQGSGGGTPGSGTTDSGSTGPSATTNPMVDTTATGGGSTGTGGESSTTTSGTDPDTTSTDSSTSQGDESSSSGTAASFFRREITIVADQIPGSDPLMDFTVLVAFTGDQGLSHVSSGGNVLEMDASDFVFRDDSLAPIPHELLLYGPASGRLGVWVRVPQVAADADTTIWLDYGSPSLVGQAPTGAWNDDYVGVWHFEDAIVNGGMVLDSSPAGNHGTALDMDAGDSAQGRVGQGIGFSQAFAAVQVGGGALDLPGPVTFEGWGRMDGPLQENGYQRLFNKGGEFNRPLTFWVMDQTIDLGFANLGVNYEWQNDWLELGYDIPGFDYGQWHHYAAVVGGPGNDVAMFVDGVRVDDTTYGYDIETGHANLYFGNWDTQGSSRRWNGLIDEYRFSDVARTDEWIEAGFNNLNTPANFTAMGPEQEIMR